MSISITVVAAAKVVDIAKAEDLEGQSLRLRIVGQGCSGLGYDLYFEEIITDLDETFESNGIKLVVDQLSLQYLEGTEIDYIDNGIMGSGFKFLNPNVKQSCGCGKSFSA